MRGRLRLEHASTTTGKICLVRHVKMLSTTTKSNKPTKNYGRHDHG